MMDKIIHTDSLGKNPQSHKKLNTFTKPDEGRLLEITLDEAAQCRGWASQRKRFIENKLKAQRDLTASIKDAECQERVERILNRFEGSRALDGSMWWRVMPEDDWQALKKGVK